MKLIRNSEIWAFKRCRLRWWWGWVCELQPYTTMPALRFGSLVHAALQKWYIPGSKRGRHPAKTFKRLYDKQLERHANFGVYDNEQWINAGELGVEMMEHYVDHYGRDKSVEVLAPEMVFKVGLRHPDNGKKYFAVGKMDAPYKDLRNGRIGILEHKTAASIQTGHLELGEQASHYWAFAPRFFRRRGYLKRGEKMSHILFNFMRKAKRDTRPQDEEGHRLNLDGSVSKRQPPDFFLRHKVWREEEARTELKNRFLDTVVEMEMARMGKLKIYKTPAPDCPRCPFFDPCQLHEAGADHKELLRLNYERWEPYAEHEISRKEA